MSSHTGWIRVSETLFQQQQQHAIYLAGGKNSFKTLAVNTIFKDGLRWDSGKSRVGTDKTQSLSS